MEDILREPDRRVPGRVRVLNATKSTFLAERASLARSFFRRMKGLLGKGGLQEGEGLVLSPCSGVHTVGMRFTIDAAFLSREGRVLKACTLPPGRIVPWVPGAVAAVELPEGTLRRTFTAEGDLVKLLNT